MKAKPDVGQTLYRLNIGNRARGEARQVLAPVIVTKVGRKYFSVCKEEHLDMAHLHTRFLLDSWKEDTYFSASYALYSSEQEWADEREVKILWTELRDFFDQYGQPKLSLTQLKQITAIVSAE